MSANSPFWQGQDTGYASFRSQALGHWPVSGPTQIFGAAEGCGAVVGGMVASGVILDEAMVYFDARCSHRYPTVEIRVADVCLDVRDTVLIAALCRGLVQIAAEEWAAGKPPPPVPIGLLRLATWQAARWGNSDSLLDPLTSRPRPACDVIAELVAHVSDALRRCGDEDWSSSGSTGSSFAATGGLREDRSSHRCHRRARTRHPRPRRLATDSRWPRRGPTRREYSRGRNPDARGFQGRPRRYALPGRTS